MATNFHRANSKGVVILHVLREVVHRIFFFLFFILIRNICIEMLHVFQRDESIYKMQAGFSLEYQNIHARYMQYKYAFLPP